MNNDINLETGTHLVTSGIGKKYDDGKPEYATFLAHFPKALEGLVKVATYGRDKYDEDSTYQNWRNVPDAKIRYTNALFRHLLKHIQGEVIDNESHLPHLYHALWNVCAVIELY